MVLRTKSWYNHTRKRPHARSLLTIVLGCRAGSQCPFRHVQPKEKGLATKQEQDRRPTRGLAGSLGTAERRSLPYRARDAKPVSSPKPVSQLQLADPREFQISQVIRRFSPARSDDEDAANLSFVLAPSDPDFPFDLAGGLRCILTVPASYPPDGRPTLRVTNPEMVRGFQINVEKGFDSLVERTPQKTLLALLNDLDRNLEEYLTLEKAQTIKINANAEKKTKAAGPLPVVARHPTPTLVAAAPILPIWPLQQKSDALNKRHADIRQLEARMGRLPNFSENPDSTKFNIPIQIPKPGRLPPTLQPLKEVTLFVPKTYDLEPCTIKLQGVYGPMVGNVQLAFEKHAREKHELTLMAHINHLTQNLHIWASETKEAVGPTETDVEAQPAPIESTHPSLPAHGELVSGNGVIDEERPHLIHMARPPEWDQHESDDTDESSYDSDDYSESDVAEDGEEDGTDQGGAVLPVAATSPSTDKGIHLSFPAMELHNIELLTLVSLSLSVKCLRCKSPLDVANIKSSDATTAVGSIRSELCPKCMTQFTFSYTPNILHQNTVRAGTIEVTGCTVTDLLPSHFQPTCSSCSTAFPTPPGMVAVRGDTPIQVCRSCHAKMTFTIHEVKFLRVSYASASLPLRRPKTENLGISAGTPLPRNGICPHYRHSYRWFRFSCCNRVHPCDRCHDAAEEHVNEHADRMICGWCSREQRFRSEECGVCGRSVVRKRKRGGFWEGGQGTRERGLMSRKEKRKYKRPSGREAQSVKKSGK